MLLFGGLRGCCLHGGRSHLVSLLRQIAFCRLQEEAVVRERLLVVHNLDARIVAVQLYSYATQVRINGKKDSHGHN